jgi:hypothetical protein
VDITNRGDERAYDLQVETRFEDLVKVAPALRDLAPGETRSVQFFFPLDTTERTARLPLVSRLRYRDANGYAFMALSCDTVSLGNPPPPRILGHSEPVSLLREGTITATIRNNGEGPMTIEAEILLPDEITCPEPRRKLTLQPGAQVEIAYPLRNFSALKGSLYYAPLLLQYEQGGIRTCSVVPGNIRIEEPRETAWWRGPWAALGLVLLWTGVLIAFQFRKGGKSK